MSERKTWTREELYLTLNLYCKLPFGKMYAGTPDVIALAEHLNRTPGSIAMKLGNFASLDPSLKQKGLTGCSKLDREVWKEFFSNPSIVLETEQTILPILPTTKVDSPIHDFAAEDLVASVKVRRMQAFFRRLILTDYGYRCCITGLTCPELLIASHIIPWKADKNNRLNPQNGLCLNALHDRAFDRGLLTIDADMKVVISPYVERKKENSPLLDCEGKTISMPEKFLPSPVFLEHHRSKIFKS